MAFVNLIGFDHFKTVPASITSSGLINSTLGNLSCGLAAGPSPAMDSIPLGQVIQGAGYNTILEVTLSNGKMRKFLCNFSQNGYVRLYYPQSYLASIPKAGKWQFGCRVYYSTGPTTSSPAVALNVRFGPTPIPQVTTPAPGVCYVEMEVDWVNLTVKTWLNGVLQGTYTGSSYVNATYTGMYLYSGAYTAYNIAGTTYNGFADVYFVVEEANEVGTTSRLGPIFVKPQAWQTAENMELFAPAVKSTPLEQFNSNNTDVGAVAADYNYASNVVKSSAHGEIGVLTAGTPTETLPIVAVSLTAISHKLSQAAAGTTLQIKQGSNQTSADKTVPGLVGSPTRKTFGFIKALDGSAWSNEKVGQIKFNIGSYRP